MNYNWTVEFSRKHKSDENIQKLFYYKHLTDKNWQWQIMLGLTNLEWTVVFWKNTNRRTFPQFVFTNILPTLDDMKKNCIGIQFLNGPTYLIVTNPYITTMSLIGLFGRHANVFYRSLSNVVRMFIKGFVSNVVNLTAIVVHCFSVEQISSHSIEFSQRRLVSKMHTHNNIQPITLTSCNVLNLIAVVEIVYIWKHY